MAGARLVVPAGQTIGGSGEIVLGTSAVGAVVTVPPSVESLLTFGPGLTLIGTGAIDLEGGTLDNQGTIDADALGQTLTIFDGSLLNEGTLGAAGGVLDLSLDRGWSCIGNGSLDNEGGTLRLGGSITTAGLNLPAFTNNGGDVLVTGASTTATARCSSPPIPAPGRLPAAPSSAETSFSATAHPSSPRRESSTASRSRAT